MSPHPMHELEEPRTAPRYTEEEERALQPLTWSELRSLLEESATPCVTLMLPTHSRHPERDQDPVRFKNLLQSVEGQLPEDEPSRALLKQLRALDQERLWAKPGGGVAVLASPARCEVVKLPHELPELAHVGEHFLIAPLVDYLAEDQTFYALSLSKNSVRLCKGTSAALVEVRPNPIPETLFDALGEERHIPHRDFYSSARAGRHVIHHGQGGYDPEEEATDERFLRDVAAGVEEVLRGESAPLVFGGVEFYHPKFQALCSYPHLSEEGVKGNLERVDERELHERFLDVVKRQVAQGRAELLADARRALAKGLASAEEEAIRSAALQGRIEVLLVSRGSLAEVGVNRSVREALLHGARVYTFEPAQMPEEAQALALLRW